MNKCNACLVRTVLLSLAASLFVGQRPSFGLGGGAVAGNRYRVVISSDIGGSDEDDIQSMIHYLVYADLFDTEGIISSPPHKGRKRDILKVIDVYEKDLPKLRTWSDKYPAPDYLRSISKQGATDPAPEKGYSNPTQGSRWIIQCAKRKDPRPLYVLVWGSITDVAQAIHDHPGIKKKIRVHFIASWNQRNDQNAFAYIDEHHPDTWFIYSDTTFRGWYMGGEQGGDLGNKSFVQTHAKGHGALGELFVRLKGGSIKMGDTPTVSYLLRGTPNDPTKESWGGRFVKRQGRPNWWIDDPDPAVARGDRPGAKTVNKWREDYLRDFQKRFDRCKNKRSDSAPKPNPTAKTPAFPGAEGFGAFAQGGRGGRVIEVANLNDSGPGSLRRAVNAEGPRIVVFRVSGTINLSSGLSIRNPYITIAGQTAPGDGICLKTYSLSVAADHVVIRFIRCRPGDNAKFEGDAISISAGRDIILDHCSASWSVDETLSASTSGQLGDVTVQWCIISESLNKSSHHKGAHGYGSLIRGGWGNGYTFHHNLYAHHRGRSPRPGNYNSASEDPEGFIFDFRNNVLYNWAGSAAGYNSDGDSITKMNFVANYYKQGPNSTRRFAFAESTTCAKAWFADNAMNGVRPKDPWSLVSFRGFSPEQIQAYKQNAPIPVADVTTDDAMTAFKRVLAHAGAVLPKRDAVDTNVVNNVIDGTGKIIDDEQQVGGWPVLKSAKPPLDTDQDGMPDEWEKAHGLNPNDKTDSAKDRDEDGYTNIEEYLNHLAAPARAALLPYHIWPETGIPANAANYANTVIPAKAGIHTLRTENTAPTSHNTQEVDGGT